jgi:hypothetical protein
VARAWRSIDISGTTPDPPPTSSAGVRPDQAKKPPIGPRTSNSSPGSTTSHRYSETSPSGSRSTVSSISPTGGASKPSAGAEATE